jgi:hypothetical protein
VSQHDMSAPAERIEGRHGSMADIIPAVMDYSPMKVKEEQQSGEDSDEEKDEFAFLKYVYL